ncbi:MAG TPA: DUF1254 domain-containing protein, partial [Gemmataceae bacterium]|nr:DUF1254 domain-containing protein [Gemmataceae bacterium]
VQARDDKSPAKLTEDEAARIAVDAYVYGYPLVLMDVTRQVLTAVSKPEGHKAPVNQFVHVKEFPDPTHTDVVSPNADTLYSIAWLDLSKEPMVLRVPEMGKRYYLMQMLDAWTNVLADPGTRTTGNGKGEFAIVGPGWKGTLPGGVKEIKSPTNMVWIIGRTQTNGKDDYAAVHAIQAKYELAPLSAWGKEYVPPADVPVDPRVEAKTPPVQQVGKMEPKEFFARLAALMADSPPAEADEPMVEKLARIGVGPGKAFEANKLDPAVAKGLERGVADARAKLVAEAKKPRGKTVNNWSVMIDKMGRYGTDYTFRSVIAFIALGANLPEDAIYARATADAEGKPLTGANRYVIRFTKGQLPPVGAFWSVTMYNSKQFFVENPINRYAIGDRDKLKFDDDGSLPLYVQNESPGKDKESNWLPAPQDDFNLIMRLYWPKKAVLDGTWKPPSVERAK